MKIMDLNRSYLFVDVLNDARVAVMANSCKSSHFQYYLKFHQFQLNHLNQFLEFQ